MICSMGLLHFLLLLLPSLLLGMCGGRFGIRHVERIRRSMLTALAGSSDGLTLVQSLDTTGADTTAGSQLRRLAPFPVSSQYERLDRPAPDHEFLLVIGLYAKHAERMESLFWQLSDPQHAKYAEYLDRQQLVELAKPHDDALDEIRRWLAPFVNVNRVIASSVTNRLKAPIRIDKLEALLQTKVYSFRHRRSRRVLLRATSSLVIPSSIAPFVSYLNINSPPLLLRASASQVPLSESMGTAGIPSTLATLYGLYDIPKNEMITNETNSQCLPSFYDESWDPNDLKLFLKQFAPNQPTPRVVEHGDRNNTPAHASTEASLDVQYLVSVAPNATTIVWTVNGSNPYSAEDEPFLEFAEAVLAMESPPLVVSISYSDDEEHIFKASEEYAHAFDQSLIKMGLRGMSVLVASGDDGVSGLRLEFESVPEDQSCKQHGPQWPSSSPYLTSVGATMLLSSANGGNKKFFATKDEVICSREMGSVITTGGGFSNVYPRPAYQSSAVEAYLKTRDIPSPSFFNASGRAYPDVAAFGNAFFVYVKGSLTQISGTSAATPTVAGMVTRWNDVRLNAGKKPLGFLNPLLYQLAQFDAAVFHDVVVGNNGALKRASKICDESFVATSGWDAVSGIGTPNFTAIRHYISLLDDTFNVSNQTIETAAVSCHDRVQLKTSSSATWSSLAGVVVIGVIAVAVVTLAVHSWTTNRNKNYASLSSDSPNTSARGLSSAAKTTDADAEVGEDQAEMSEINLSE